MMRVRKVLEYAKKAQLKKDDINFIVIGRTGSGKTSFMLCCHDELGGKQEAIALYKREVVPALKAAGKNGKFVFDEAIEGVNSKESMSKFNKELEKMFLILRENSVISFLGLPSYRLLARTFREDIIDGIFFVYKRGRVAFYGPKEIRKINRHLDKYGSFGGARPSFVDHFPNYRAGNGYLAAEYNERKKKKLVDAMDDFETQTNGKKQEKKEMSKSDLVRMIKLVNPGAKVSDVAKALGAADSHVRGVIDTSENIPN